MIKVTINYVNDQPICEEIFECGNTFIDDYTIINNSIVLNVNRCQQFYYIKIGKNIYCGWPDAKIGYDYNIPVSEIIIKEIID